jgi:hypothetical protein
MSFSVNKLDVSFFQRNVDNTEYEQVNISGSSAIFYLDEHGILTAGSMADLLKSSGTVQKTTIGKNSVGAGSTLYGVDTLIAGHPNRLARYYVVPGATTAYKIAETQTHTLDTLFGIGIGKTDTEPYVNATLDVSGTVIITGSLTVTGQIYGTASYAINSGISDSSFSSSYALTASYVSGSSLNSESSSYSLTSSYSTTSSYTSTSSYVFSSVSSSLSISSETADFAWWAENSNHAISSSYSLSSSYISSSDIRGGTDGYFPVWSDSTLSNTSSIRQISSSLVEISSSVIPVSDDTFSLGSLIRRWANGFITTLSSSVAYVKTIYGGNETGSSLIIQGSSIISGSVIINPNGDPVAIGTYLTESGSLNVGGVIWGCGNAFFAGGTILVGSKALSTISNSFSDVMIVDIPADETIYSKVTLHGKWNGGGPVGYSCECFFQKGDNNAYSQPGVILNQTNNNFNDKYVSAQILDTSLTPTNATIKLQLQTSNDWIPTSKLIYEIRGNFNTVT